MAAIVAARMRANGKFSDVNLEQLQSVSINRVMSSSDAIGLESPLITLVRQRTCFDEKIV